MGVGAKVRRLFGPLEGPVTDLWVSGRGSVRVRVRIRPWRNNLMFLVRQPSPGTDS